MLPFIAFSGGLVAAVLIYFLAWRGVSSPVRLILVGIGLTFITTALTELMITFGDINLVSQALVWLVGSVYGRSWQQVSQLGWWIFLAVPLVWFMARELNIFNFGDDLACALGVRVEWYRSLLMLLSVAIASACVATTGSIGFVGLIAPHLARQLVGVSHQVLLPTAAIIGGMLVVIADLLARVLFAPIELPCGIITAIIGAPYFIYLLIRNRHFSE
jgi:iron complex transport system permease protein